MILTIQHLEVIGQVDFSHYSTDPVELAEALVNTDQRSAGGEDGISDLASLEEFLSRYESLWKGVAAPPTNADLPRIHELRQSLRDVFQAEDDSDASALVNGILADNTATPRVSLHSGTPHLHFEPVGSSMATWLGAVTAMGMATVLIDHGVDRFGVCCSKTCDDVFVDTSRNRSRRHCSSTCSTREAVAAYRRRQSD
jgi:predicted RNA-binding Zn ribbon-like protein